MLKSLYKLSERKLNNRIMVKNVLITGASSGIGREIALKFAKNGYFVVAIGRTGLSSLQSLEKEILQGGGKVYTKLCDVSNFQDICELFAELSDKSLSPDILINNAGISHIGLLQDMDYEEWQTVINTNLSSVFYCSKNAIPYMLSKKSGKIINISSMWGNVGASCEVAYSASKGGVNSFSKALAKELAPSGITVNAIAFGAVDTRMNSFLDSEEKKRLTDEIPVGRILSANEAAEIVYNISTMNDYITGQVITADGGMT